MAIVIIVLCAVVLVVGIVVVECHRDEVNARGVEALYQAAATGDRDQLQQEVSDGLPIDLPDKQGNTALHFAYYRGQQEAIDALVAFGADDNLRNDEDLSPVEMSAVATIEDLLSKGAQCLDGSGNWLHEAQGRIIYNQLRYRKPRIYTPALVRCVLNDRDRGSLLHLAIKLGVRGSEERLADMLHGYGTKDMAVDYLNAGSTVLREAAEKWAKRNNYYIHSTSRRARVLWGQF